MPLPAAATFIQQTDHRLQSTASVVDANQTSSAEPRHASLDDMPTVSDEVVAGNEDDDGSVGDDTILADEAVLTVNEVEEVLRDAFAEADQLVSIANTQEGSIPVSEDLTRRRARTLTWWRRYMTPTHLLRNNSPTHRSQTREAQPPRFSQRGDRPSTNQRSR